MFLIWCLLACFLRLGDCVSCKDQDVFQSKEKLLTRQMAKGEKGSKLSKFTQVLYSKLALTLSNQGKVVRYFSVILYLRSPKYFLSGFQVAEAGRCTFSVR